MNKKMTKEELFEHLKGMYVSRTIREGELLLRAVEIIKEQDIQLNSLKTIFGLHTTK